MVVLFDWKRSSAPAWEKEVGLTGGKPLAFYRSSSYFGEEQDKGVTLQSILVEYGDGRKT